MHGIRFPIGKVKSLHKNLGGASALPVRFGTARLGLEANSCWHGQGRVCFCPTTERFFPVCVCRLEEGLKASNDATMPRCRLCRDVEAVAECSICFETKARRRRRPLAAVRPFTTHAHLTPSHPQSPTPNSRLHASLEPILLLTVRCCNNDAINDETMTTSRDTHLNMNNGQSHPASHSPPTVVTPSEKKLSLLSLKQQLN